MHSSSGIALRVNNGTATLNNCVILNNTGNRGAGLNIDDSKVFVLNTRIEANTANSEGVVRIFKYIEYFFKFNSSTLHMENCFVRNNTLFEPFRGIISVAASNFDLRNSLFEENLVTSGVVNVFQTPPVCLHYILKIAPNLFHSKLYFSQKYCID